MKFLDRPASLLLIDISTERGRDGGYICNKWQPNPGSMLTQGRLGNI